MNSSNFSAAIMMREIKRSFSYSNQAILTLSITYPEVTLPHNPLVQGNINRHVWEQVNGFYHYASSDLYQQATAAYKDAQENGYPFHNYDAVLQYEITYNLNCHLSLYRDQYEFTGGAHGSTVRASDTWNLISGRRLPLSSVSLPGQDYRIILIEQILQQADWQIQQDPGIFFEDYRDLIVKHWNEKNYYLTPSGIAIYYQQYDIAPYSTGIVVFTIPYETLQWHPSCRAPLSNRQSL